MGQRFIFVPDQTRQRCEELFRTDDDLVMIGFVSVGDEARVFELVSFAFGEGDGKSLDRLADHAAHHCGNRGRIDASGKKHSERNVGHQPQTHRLAKQLRPLFDVSLVVANLVVFRKINVPVTTNR